MLTQPVWAVTIEGLNKVCKTYANNGFEIGDNFEDVTEGRMCTAYVAATLVAKAFHTNSSSAKNWRHLLVG